MSAIRAKVPLPAYLGTSADGVAPMIPLSVSGIMAFRVRAQWRGGASQRSADTRPDQTVDFDRREGSDDGALRDRRRRSVRRDVDALPVRTAPLPPVIRAFDRVVDDRAPVQRSAAMQ